MVVVYLLWHTNPLNEDEKLVGVFSSREKAEEVINSLKNQPGFKDSPEGFEIIDYTLDTSSWQEGFISVEEAMKD